MVNESAPTPASAPSRRQLVPVAVAVGAVLLLVVGIAVGSRLGGGSEPVATPPPVSSPTQTTDPGGEPTDDASKGLGGAFDPATLDGPTRSHQDDVRPVDLSSGLLTAPASVPTIPTGSDAVLDLSALAGNSGLEQIRVASGALTQRGPLGAVVTGFVQSGSTYDVEVQARTSDGWLPLIADPIEVYEIPLTLGDEEMTACLVLSRWMDLDMDGDVECAPTSVIVPGAAPVKIQLPDTDRRAFDWVVEGAGWHVELVSTGEGYADALVVWADADADPSATVTVGSFVTVMALEAVAE